MHGAALGKQALIAVQVMIDLDVLHQKRRIEIFDVGMAANQARFQAQRANPAGQRADRFEHAEQGGTGAIGGRGVRRWRCSGNDIVQGQPVGARDGVDPGIVGADIQDLVDCVVQVDVAQCGGQAAIGDTAFELSKKAIVREHADIGIQAGVAAALKQARQIAAQSRYERRATSEQMRQGTDARAGERPIRA